MPKAAAIRWRRMHSRAAGGTAYVVRNEAGQDVLHVHRKKYCGFWYVYVGVDQDEPDGTRFEFMWEARAYAEDQIKNGRVSLTGPAVEE